MNPSGNSLTPPRRQGAAGLSRRAVLAGLGSAAVALGATMAPAPAFAAAPADDRLRSPLDKLAATLAADPAPGVARHALVDAADRLARLNPAGLSPAQRLLRAAVKDGIETEAALLAVPAGQDTYPLALRLNAGPGFSPQEAHSWGQAQVRVLHAEADSILRAQGLAEGTVAERFRAFWGDPRHLYPNSADGRRRAVGAMNAQMAATRQRLPQAFRNLSPADLIVTTPPAGEATDATVGKRLDPSADGTRPGSYIVDLRRIDRRPAWTLPSVVHHELAPGHLLQAPFGERASPHPLQLRYARSYSEGWAIYAEQLVAEEGWLGEDPLARLGYIHWMLFRIGRLMADTGVHGLGWSEQQAIDAVREIQGEPVAFVSIEEDVARSITRPGAVAGHMLTAAALSRLREEARAALGPRFSLAGFHDAVLRHGPLSVPGLEAAVRAWIEAAAS